MARKVIDEEILGHFEILQMITKNIVLTKYFVAILKPFFIVPISVFSYRALSGKAYKKIITIKNMVTIPAIRKITGLFSSLLNNSKSR